MRKFIAAIALLAACGGDDAPTDPPEDPCAEVASRFCDAAIECGQIVEGQRGNCEAFAGSLCGDHPPTDWEACDDALSALECEVDWVELRDECRGQP